MSRSRDLSGFGTSSRSSAPVEPKIEVAPPPKPVRIRPSASKKPTQKREPAETGQRRITLSLPTALAQDLRTVTRRDATYYIDVILNAFLDHAAELGETRSAPRSIGGVAVPPPRRRRPPGRTQIPLNIEEGVLAEIDLAAHQLRMDRSTYVAELLKRAI